MALIKGLEISQVGGQIYLRDTLLVFHPKWSAESKFRWFMTGVLHFLSLLLVIITFPFSLFFVLARCQEYQRAVVLGSTLTEVCFSDKYSYLSYISYLLPGNSQRTRPGLHSSFPGESSYYRYQNKGKSWKYMEITFLSLRCLRFPASRSWPRTQSHSLSMQWCITGWEKISVMVWIAFLC
jgi:hypothetical protein